MRDQKWIFGAVESYYTLYYAVIFLSMTKICLVYSAKSRYIIQRSFAKSSIIHVQQSNIYVLFFQQGEYILPDHLSYTARDLIPRILTVDPMMRISIPGIRQHPWFSSKLPPYLAAPPLDTTEQAREVRALFILSQQNNIIRMNQ